MLKYVTSTILYTHDFPSVKSLLQRTQKKRTAQQDTYRKLLFTLYKYLGAFINDGLGIYQLLLFWDVKALLYWGYYMSRKNDWPL